MCITMLQSDASMERCAAMSAKSRITINLEPSEYAALQRLATGTERSLAWLGRHAICTLLERAQVDHNQLTLPLSELVRRGNQ